MRTDVKKALRRRRISFFGANRELRRIETYLHPDEEVHDLLACSFGDTGGRALLVVTDERVLVYKDGWVFRNSQSMSYNDIRTMEIRTGLFFGKIKFKGEGMSFEISKVGRFAADHAAKIIRSRIGSRYKTWDAQRQFLRDQRALQAQQGGNSSPASADVEMPPVEMPPPSFEQFLLPAVHPDEKSSTTLINELERLSNLKDRGLLSQEEYESAKRKLLE